MTGDFRGTVRVCGESVHVDLRAGGDGPPLLLCNGIGANLELLEPFVDALAAQPGQRVPTIRFDVPGTGGSPNPRWPRRMSGLARLLGELVTDLGYGEVDVLGISWGGALAQEFARAHPQRCRRVVLCATSMGMVMVPAGLRVLLTLASPVRYFRPSRMRETGARIYGGGFGSDPALAARFATAARAPDPVGYYYQLLAGATPGRRRRPDHPAGQRPDDGGATTPPHAARDPRRRPPRAAHPRR
jgi:poly(3-hydroxyalkanoate) depolymerase